MQRGMADDQASRRKKKRAIFIFFIVLFAAGFGSFILVVLAIKQEVESESLSASSPEEKIRIICDLTPFPASCFNPIWSLHRNVTPNSSQSIKTYPSMIFTLSLRAALNELNTTVSSTKMAISKAKKSKTLSALKNCDALILDSWRLVNMSLARMRINPDDEIIRIAKLRSDLNEWVTTAWVKIDGCLIGLDDDSDGSNMKMKILKASKHVENSSAIVSKMDTIRAIFNPPIFDYDFRFLDLGFVFAIFFLCLQYLFLVTVFCIVIRS